MAIPFLNNINLSDNQLLNAKLQVTSTAPTAAVGQIYFDSTSADETAKYYSNVTDTWVSLKEYTFPAVAKADGYITSAITGTTSKPIVKFNLNATGTADNTTYLRGDNQWESISAIPGTYTWSIQGDTGGPTAVPSASAVSILGGQDLETTLTGTTLTVDLKVGPQASGAADNYIMNQGTAVVDFNDSLAFSQLTSGNPPDGFSTVKKTTLGDIPVEALTLVKTYIDDSVAGGLIYQGGFDGATGQVAGTSDYLDGRGTQIAVNRGWTYTVTVAGTFYGETVEVGDVLIAEDDLTSGTGALSDWTTVQNNIDLATLSTVGIGNVNSNAGDADLGISVSYASGTASVGLNIVGLALDNLVEEPTDYYLPIYDDGGAINNRARLSELLAFGNSVTSRAYTITDTDTITYPTEFALTAATQNDTIIQLVDTVTNETVYADVDRISTTQATITFATTPTNSIRVLVQKIG